VAAAAVIITAYLEIKSQRKTFFFVSTIKYHRNCQKNKLCYQNMNKIQEELGLPKMNETNYENGKETKALSTSKINKTRK
jgi:hypothetical protein